MAFGISSLARIRLERSIVVFLLTATGLCAETVPPVVEISTHGGASLYTCQRKINLKGTFSDLAPSSGLRSVALNTGAPRKGNLKNWRFPAVPLEFGLNVFTVTGVDKDGNVAQDSIEIYRLSPPEEPLLSGPTNGATGVSLNPILSWTGSDLDEAILEQFPSAATNYQVALDVTNPPEAILYEDLTAPSVQIGPLEPTTTYYWRVKAINDCGRSRSKVWSFTTTDPNSITLLHVDDNAPNDPGPDDPYASDPLENGSEEHPFDAIQEAIDVALPGDEVHVAEGWYSEAFFYGSSVYMADGVDLYGGYNGADWSAERDPESFATVIDGDNFERCVVFEDAEATLDGFTLQRGFVDFCCHPTIAEIGGGGVLAYASAKIFSVTISNNVIKDNFVYYYGAGIRTGLGVTPNMVGNTFTGNHVEIVSTGESGSAIYAESTNARIIDNVILDNSISGFDGFSCAETKGGAVSISGGEVVGNSVTDNSCYVNSSYCGFVRGGGIYVDSEALIDDNVVVNNSIAFLHWEGEDAYEASGGGIYTNGGRVRGNLIQGNFAGSTTGFPFEDDDPAFNQLALGGGLYIGSGTAELNWVEGNELHASTTGVGRFFMDGDAGGGTALGGGIYAENAVVRNNVIVNNLAQGEGFDGVPSRNVTPGTGTARGGGLYALDSISLNNTMVGNNALATAGGGDQGAFAVREGGGYFSGNDSRLVNSIVWENTPNDLLNTPVDAVSYSDSGDPAFLAGEGNRVADPAFTDGYHLDPSSSCINSGSPDSEPLAGTTDYDGEDRVRLGRIDMGAFEAGVSDPIPPEPSNTVSPVTDWIVSPSDATGEVENLFILALKLDAPAPPDFPGVNAFGLDAVYNPSIFSVSEIATVDTQVADWLIVDGSPVEVGRYRIVAAAGLGTPLVGESTAPLLNLICRAASIPTGGTICVENLNEGLKHAASGFAKVTVLLYPTPTPTFTRTPVPTLTDTPLPTATFTHEPIPTDTLAPLPTATLAAEAEPSPTSSESIAPTATAFPTDTQEASSTPTFTRMFDGGPEGPDGKVDSRDLASLLEGMNGENKSAMTLFHFAQYWMSRETR